MEAQERLITLAGRVNEQTAALRQDHDAMCQKVKKVAKEHDTECQEVKHLTLLGLRLHATYTAHHHQQPVLGDSALQERLAAAEAEVHCLQDQVVKLEYSNKLQAMLINLEGHQTTPTFDSCLDLSCPATASNFC